MSEPTFRSLDYYTSLTFGPEAEITKEVRKETDPEKLAQIFGENSMTLDSTIEKILTYAPFKIPGTPSTLNLGPTTIVDKIKEKIKRIEGPINCMILTPTQKLKDILNEPHDPLGRIREAPVYLLLGDYHEGVQPCDPECTKSSDCYYVSNKAKQNSPFLELLEDSLGQECQVDFFLEAWIHEARRSGPYNPSEHKYKFLNSYIMWLIHYIHSKIQDKSLRQTYPHVRIHSSDIRWKPREADDIIKCIASKSTFTDFCREAQKTFPEYFTSTDNKSSVEELCKDLLNLVDYCIVNGSLNFFRSKWFRNHPFMDMYSSVLVQIKQLPQQLQDMLYSEFSLYKTQRVYTDRMKQWTTSFNTLEEKYKTLHWYVTEHWFETLLGDQSLELYFFARSLKSPWRGWPSQLSVTYYGYWHSANILYFMLKTQLYTLDYISNAAQTPLSNYVREDRISKCVKIDSSLSAQDSLFNVLLNMPTFENSTIIGNVLAEVNPDLVHESLQANKKTLLSDPAYSAGMFFNPNISFKFIRILLDVLDDQEAFEVGKMIFMTQRGGRLSNAELLELQKRFHHERGDYLTLLPLDSNGLPSQTHLDQVVEKASQLDSGKTMSLIFERLVAKQSLEINESNLHFASEDYNSLKKFEEKVKNSGEDASIKYEVQDKLMQMKWKLDDLIKETAVKKKEEEIKKEEHELEKRFKTVKMF